jgi:mannosyl-oligosaccharide alpha-1,2-mannosidase
MYIAESKNGTRHSKMGHLACFIGGLFALSAEDAHSPDETAVYLESGAGITETCYRGYANSATGLGPEEMQFDNPSELSSANSGHRYYILRPEVIESYFYMWRITKDERYRGYAWEAVLALEQHARCGNMGYCGLKDVQANPPVHDDLQQSYFLAETLKYVVCAWVHTNP